MDRWERGADREDFPSVWSLPEYIQYRICCTMTSRLVLIVSGVLGVLFQVVSGWFDPAVGVPRIGRLWVDHVLVQSML